MRIIAPAKKMIVDTDSFAVDSLPQFLEQTEQLKVILQSMSPKELQSLWKCNDAIARLSVDGCRDLYPPGPGPDDALDDGAKMKGPEDLRAFDQLGYYFYEALSAENYYVFLKQPAIRVMYGPLSAPGRC